MSEDLSQHSNEYLQQVIEYKQAFLNQLTFRRLGLAGYTESDENSEDVRRQIEEVQAEITKVEELLASRVRV